MISTYLKKKIHDQMIGGVAFTMPTTLYVAMSKTAPVADGTNVSEPTGANYARVAVLNNKTNFTNCDDNGSIKNKTKITFAESSGNWGKLTHYAIYDSLTDGNMLFANQLQVERDIAIDMQLFIDINGLEFTLN